PILWGTLVFVNLQAAFLSPPVAMSAFYLKGVSPPHVTLNQIFAGMMPYMVVIILCMVIMYIWPGMTLWLPNYLYGGLAGGQQSGPPDMADIGQVNLSATEAAAEITRNHRRPVLFRISRRHRPDGRIGVWPHCGPRRG